MNRNFNYKNLSPFKWFVLENFPFIEADFDAITDWQLFCKLGKKLNTIIDNVNILGTQVESLTDFVSNYFDNLDVQEEINNKLNEMAESGELTEIIAQYLQLAGLLCFNTVNDMKNATNLINGSFVKTYGLNEYNDGKGYFYKIRNILNTDVIDNINIIPLNNYNNLIAERIIQTISKNFYLGAFHKKYSETDKRTYLFRSDDGYNFSQLKNIEIIGSKGHCSDPSIVYDEKSGWFLMAYSNQNLAGDDFSVTFSILRSKNLIDWENVDIRLDYNKTLLQGYSKFSPDLFYDKDGNLNVIISIDKTPGGYDWELLIAKCNNIELLTFDYGYIINTNTNNNLYDASIIYFKNLYYMISANHDTSIVELYTSNDLINFTQVNDNLFNIKNPRFTDDVIEACQLLITDDKLLAYTEMHDNEKFICGIFKNNYTELENQFLVPSLYKYKQGSIINISNEKAKFIINNITTDIINTSNKNVVDFSLGLINLTEDTIIDSLTIIPDQVYRINGNYNLTINNIIDPFNCREIKIIPNNTSGKLILNAYNNNTDFKFETNFSQYSKGKIITINSYFGFTSNNYSNTKDITNEIIFDNDFLNAFTINQSSWIIKNGILFYNMVLIAKTDNFSKLDCITMPYTANVGQKSYAGGPGSNNQLSIQGSNGSATFNVDFVGTNGNWQVISGQILVNDFN